MKQSPLDLFDPYHTSYPKTIVDDYFDGVAQTNLLVLKYKPSVLNIALFGALFPTVVHNATSGHTTTPHTSIRR